MADGPRQFRSGATPGSFNPMPRVVLRDMKGLTGKEVAVKMARKGSTWGVIPEGATTMSAVDGEKLQVDDGMKMPVSLVDVQVEDQKGAQLLGKADAFRAERGAWSVILADSKPGTASLAPPGNIRDKGSKEAWAAPVKCEKVVRDGREQSGIFADRKFLPGDCIFVEAPILSIEEVGDVDRDMKGLKINKAHKRAVQKFLGLPDTLKGAALGLFCPERMLVTLSDGKKQWSEPLSKETFFEQLPKVGIEVGSDEDDQAIVWRFIRIWESNNMAVASGTAMFAGWTSRLNHSCQPNAARVLLPGNQIATVAIQAIEPGEEVVGSYLLDDDLLRPRARRRELLEPWDFVCGCARCLGVEEDEFESGGPDAAEQDRIESLCASVQQATVDIDQTRSDLTEALSSLPEGHWLALRVEVALRDLEKLDGNISAAVERQTAVLRFWDERLPAGASIHRAQLRRTQGDFHRMLGNYMAAFRFYSEGLSEVSSFQFPGHTACVELREKLQSLLACDKGSKCKQEA